MASLSLLLVMVLLVVMSVYLLSMKLLFSVLFLPMCRLDLLTAMEVDERVRLMVILISVMMSHSIDNLYFLKNQNLSIEFNEKITSD